MPSVLVTGANGFLAFHIIHALLERGYSVVGTVRSESKTKVIRQKLNSENLKFAVVEDITAPGAFDEVLQQYQFDAVFHTSSPFTLSITNVETELYEPAIKGTVGIMKSVRALAPSVKQVVITSSFTAIVDVTKGDWPDKIYDESDWNPMTYEEGLSSPLAGYFTSKRLAEEAAWKFMSTEQPTFSLTTLCPPWIWGPPDETDDIRRLGSSASVLHSVFNGTTFTQGVLWLWVDVRDVALAHILAIESPAAANQRYLISQGRFSSQAITDFIWEHYPERAAAKGLPRGSPGSLYPAAGVYGLDNSKSLKDLGLKYRSFEATLANTFRRFEELEALAE